MWHGGACGVGEAARWVRVFQRAASCFNGLRERSWSPARLFHVPPTYRLLGQLKKALPAVSLSETDLRSLCSKITAQPSTTVLMHMKQSGSMASGADLQHAWMHVHACMHTHKGRSRDLQHRSNCDTTVYNDNHTCIPYYMSKLCM